MTEVGAVNAKVTAEVSDYINAMVASANATKALGDVTKLSRDEIIALISAQDRAAGEALKLMAAADDAAAATNKWSEANQRASMSMSGMHDQALKMNDAMDKGAESGEHWGGEIMKMVGLGAAMGGGMAIATGALEALKEATIGSVEEFVEFGHALDIAHLKLNVPVETAAAWKQASGVTGASIETITNALAMMDTRLETGNKQAITALHDLGISIEELRAAGPDEQVRMLAAAFEMLTARGEKADVVIKELMGRGGLGMLPLLTHDAQELVDKLQEINGPLEQQVKTAHEYEKAAAVLRTHWEAIKRALTEPLVGGLASWLEAREKYGQATTAGFMAPGAFPLPPDLPFQKGKGETFALPPEPDWKKWGADSQKAYDDMTEAGEKYAAATEKLNNRQKEHLARTLDDNVTSVDQHASAEEERQLRKWDKEERQEEQALGNSENAEARSVARQIELEAYHHREAVRYLEERMRQEEAAYDRHIRALAQSWGQLGSDLQALSQMLVDFGAASDSVIVGIANSAAQGADIVSKSIQQGYLSWSDLFSAAGSIYKTGGQKGAGAGAVGGAIEGAEIGSLFGPEGAAIGAAGGALLGALGGIFGTPEYKKVMDDIGKSWGVSISEGLAKAIASTEAKDHVGKTMAELLNIDAIMKESGMDPAHFSDKIGDLMNAVALGVVPAKEGIDQLGKAFNDLRAAADAGSTESEAAMIKMIQRARELGESVPEISKFILDTLKGIPDDLKTLFAGLGGGARGAGFTPETAAANQQILGATFSALAAQEGVVQAAEDLKKAFDALMAGMPADMPLSQSLQHMAMIEDLLKDADFKKTAEASHAGAQAMKGLQETGNLSQETSDAFAVDAKQLMKQAADAAIEHGYDPDQARIAAEEANLPLLTQLQHAQALGAHFDAETEAMIRQAQADGVLPLKTIQEQQLDELRSIRMALHGNAPGGGGEEIPGGDEEGGGGGGHGNEDRIPERAQGGPIYETGPHLMHAGEFVLTAGQAQQGAGPKQIVIPVSIGGEKVAEFIVDVMKQEVYSQGSEVVSYLRRAVTGRP